MYVIYTRITDADMEIRRSGIKALADVLTPDEKGGRRRNPSAST